LLFCSAFDDLKEREKKLHIPFIVEAQSTLTTNKQNHLFSRIFIQQPAEILINFQGLSIEDN
jgi:hypothetical protein